jgi:hypothetical protein
MNNKVTSKNIGTLASNVLKNDNSSNIQKSLAASALSQMNPNNQTGSKMEDVAAKALSSNKYNDTTKSLAASVLAQSNKKR